MSSRWRVAIFVTLFVAVIVGVLYWLFADDEPSTVRVERGNLDVTIETVGRVVVENEQVVRAGVAGQIDALGARAGDQVRAGEILIMLDGDPHRDAVDDAERAVERAEFALQAAEAATEDDQSVENRVAVLDAVADLEAAEQALNDAKEALSEVAILSPRDGIVLELLVARGDIVTEAQPVAAIARQESLELIADVDELDLPNVSPGAQVNFRVDSYPAREIEGQVVRTAPTAEQRGGATVFATTIQFEPPEALDLRPGMNADVSIVTEARQDVLLLPDRALRTVGERSFVEVLGDGETQEVEVITGFRSAGMVEIVSGLSEDDRVVLP